ncbi:MAG: hypothetical protein KA120_09000 [Candidatus Goldbacteria bacterium]|nr:hypothetical protein [Candidatus Goldiibacteriota bacterium]
MGNCPDGQIDRSIIINIVKERLVQKAEKQEILNSLIKIGYSKQQANDIVREAIKELKNAGIYLKSNNVYYITGLIIIALIICFCLILKWG